MCRMYSTGAYWFLLMMMRINYGFQTQTQTTYQLRWSSRLVTLLWTERHVQCIFQLNFNFSIKRFENVHISSGHVKSVKETINQRNLKKNFQKLHPQSKVKWMKKKNWNTNWHDSPWNRIRWKAYDDYLPSNSIKFKKLRRLLVN